jgi:hypothetical protein
VEYEAKLMPTTGGAPITAKTDFAKAEWKTYGNGDRRFKVIVSKLNLPDGAAVELGVDGRQIDNMVVQGGRTRYERESDRNEVVPPVEAGQVLQVSYAGDVILEGRFYAE